MRTLSPDVKLILNSFTVQRFLTSRLLRFIKERGIVDILKSMQCFTLDEAVNELQDKLSYKLFDRTRIRMVKVIIDILYECEYIEKKEGSHYWKRDNDLKIILSNEELEILGKIFNGQLDFFERCITYSDKFMSGSPPLYNFDDASASIWEEFLGNPEFRFARSMLLKLLISGIDNNADVLDLCYGPGFDMLQIQEHNPDLQLTALDFKNIFYDKAFYRVINNKKVKWVKSECWDGFGSPLPFPDNTFGIVFFACADPYIPETFREYVYRDIFRILKKGGTLGILNRCYPDSNKEYVKDKWARRGVLCHDFAESVCAGWYGFYDAEESIGLFKNIGYNITAEMFNASIWRLDKP